MIEGLFASVLFQALLMKYVRPFHRSEEVSWLVQRVVHKRRAQQWIFMRIFMIYSAVAERRSGGGRSRERQMRAEPLCHSLVPRGCHLSSRTCSAVAAVMWRNGMYPDAVCTYL